jgi:uncharacterized FlaG/YvyC family protein
MAFSAIKSAESARDQGFSSAVHISIPDAVKYKESDKNLYEIDTEKRVEESKKSTDEKIARVTELMDNYVRSIQKDIKIQVNNRTGDISVKVISEETGKVIREIPSQEMLELAARMEEISGVFFDQKV